MARLERFEQTLEPTAHVEITAIVGNGRLLAGFDRSGGLKTLTAPHLDYPQHLCSSRIAVRAESNGRDLWLNADGWRHEQMYLEETGILVTRSSRTGGRIALEQRAAVVGDAVLVGIAAANAAQPSIPLVTFEFAFQIGGQPLANALEYSPASASLLAYHREHALAIGMLPSLTSVTVASRGSVEGGTSLGAEALMTAGEVSAALTGAVQPICLLLIAWGSPQQAGATLATTKSRIGAITSWPRELMQDMPERRYSATGKFSPGSLAEISAAAPACYARSLTVIAQLTDRSGAIVAGPPIDADFRRSGGYAFCWPRDGGFIAHALDVAGNRQAARAFFDWALDVQPSDGIWKQRYYADGALAPAWADHQLDGVGTVLWALGRHLEGSSDGELAHRGLDAALRSFAEVSRLADSDGWPPITQNLWEDQRGAHLYTAASLLAGARGWRKWAETLRNSDGARLLGAVERHLQKALAEWPVDPRTGALARAITGGRSKAVPDFTPDGSVLGVSVPFGCLAPDDLRLRATIDVVRKELSFPSGRIRRYAGDRYRGGNAWPLISLWLAWHDVRAGNRAEAGRLYRQVLNDRTPAGLLAEQVEATTGRASWVVPLAWAHAWFLLVSDALVADDVL